LKLNCKIDVTVVYFGLNSQNSAPFLIAYLTRTIDFLIFQSR